MEKKIVWESPNGKYKIYADLVVEAKNAKGEFKVVEASKLPKYVFVELDALKYQESEQIKELAAVEEKDDLIGKRFSAEDKIFTVYSVSGPGVFAHEGDQLQKNEQGEVLNPRYFSYEDVEQNLINHGQVVEEKEEIDLTSLVPRKKLEIYKSGDLIAIKNTNRCCCSSVEHYNESGLSRVLRYWEENEDLSEYDIIVSDELIDIVPDAYKTDETQVEQNEIYGRISEKTDDVSFYLSVESHYCDIKDAKGKVDAVMFEMGQHTGEKYEIDSIITCSVEYARSFAQDILKICDEIDGFSL